MSIKVMSAKRPGGQTARRTSADAARLARGLAVFVLVASVLGILFAGMFPFDFSRPIVSTALPQTAPKFDWNPFPYDHLYADRITNVLFFIPFGVGLASVVTGRNRRVRDAARIVLAGVLGCALSATVETSQIYVSFRDPTLADVWANTLGAILGAAGYVVIGDRVLLQAANWMHRLRRVAHPYVLAALTAIYAALHLAAPLVQHNAGDLSVWDPGMALVVGNDVSGDREWNGSVSYIALADRAAGAGAATELARGGEPSAVFGDALVADYALSGTGSAFVDRNAHLKPLEWSKPPAAQLTDPRSANVGRENWLRTNGAIPWAIHRIQTSAELSMAVRAASFDDNQHGPARVIAITRGVRDWDALIGQNDADLVVRVRTAVRNMPELYVRDVFADSNAHDILVTVKQANIIVYVDGAERGRCEVTPEAKVVWALYPRSGFRLRLENYGYRSYAAIYRLLVFIPLATLLVASVVRFELKARHRSAIAFGGLLAFALAIEIILGKESASGFQVKNLLISLAIGWGTAGVLLWALRRRVA